MALGRANRVARAGAANKKQRISRVGAGF